MPFPLDALCDKSTASNYHKSTAYNSDPCITPSKEHNYYFHNIDGYALTCR